MMVINSDQPHPNSSSFPKWRPDAAILENKKTLGTRLGESPRYPPGGGVKGQGYKSESLGLE